MKKVILLILVVLGTLMSTRSSAQLYAMRDSVQNGYNFWLYLPDGYEDMRAKRLEHPDSAEIKSPMPIVLFLHGRSLSGTDLSTVRKYGTIDAVKRGRKVNAVVIAPQVNHGDWWRPERLMNVIKWVSKRYDVDLTRLYVLGMSLGGYGTLDFAATYPEHTAAAIALCGGSTLRATALGKLNEVPLWIMHGTGDASVAVSESRRVKRAMEAANPQTPRLRYDEWVGAGHSIYARTFYMDEAYEWLFKHRTTDENRPVNTSVEIPTSRYNNAYSGLPRGGIALTVYDPPTKSTTKGRYMGEDIPQPAPSKNNADSKVSSNSSNKEATTSKGATYHTVESGETLSHIAVKYGMSVTQLCELNDIDKDEILGIGIVLQVSAGEAEPEYIYHTLTAEDNSYWVIANRYNITVDDLMKLNGLTEPKMYRVGEQIIVGKNSATPSKNKQSSNPSQSAKYHTIQDGDTLGHIAVKYDTTVKRLCVLNNIEKDAILSIGKKLRVK